VVIWAWGKTVVVLTTDVTWEKMGEAGVKVAVVVTEVERVVAGTTCAMGEAALAMEEEALWTLGKGGAFGGWLLLLLEFPEFPWLGGIWGPIMLASGWAIKDGR
jgi:hypothetical protein